jgi:hypothetical protein
VKWGNRVEPQVFSLPTGEKVSVPWMVRYVPSVTERLKFGNDIDAARLSELYQLLEITHRESTWHGQMPKPRKLQSTPVIVREVQEEGVHLPLSHELQEFIVVPLGFQQA